jgi:hypothetical protein
MLSNKRAGPKRLETSRVMAPSSFHPTSVLTHANSEHPSRASIRSRKSLKATFSYPLFG